MKRASGPHGPELAANLNLHAYVVSDPSRRATADNDPDEDSLVTMC